MRPLILALMLASLVSVSEDRFEPAVKQYHESVETRKVEQGFDQSELFREVVRRYRGFGIPEPRHEGNLSGACERLARVFDLQGDHGVLTSHSQLIQFTIRHFGVTDSFYFPVVAAASSQAEALEWVRRLVDKELADMGFNRFGIHWSPKSHTLAMVFSRRLVQLSPFPRKAEQGTAHLLFGSLLGDSRDPLLLISTPDGAFLQQTPKVSGDIFWTQVYLPEESGEYMLEILVEEDGPQVASLFPVYVGEEPPPRPVTKLYPGIQESAGSASLERQLFGLVNDARRGKGLVELKWDRSLCGSARLHSKSMARQGRLTHTRQPSEAETAHSFQENVSISTSIATSHTNLMASPSHRRNIMNPDARRGGVGIEVRELEDKTRVLFITQRFGS